MQENLSLYNQIYYQSLKNYSTITDPLNELLKDGVEWKWSKDQQKSFQQLKGKLSNAPVLTHFSNTLWHKHSYFAHVSIQRRANNCLNFAHIVQKQT